MYVTVIYIQRVKEITITESIDVGFHFELVILRWVSDCYIVVIEKAAVISINILE